MNADAFFTIGSTHQVCQDYALAGEGYVVLSDGCSSGQYSEVGAMLTALSLRDSIVIDGLYTPSLANLSGVLKNCKENIFRSMRKSALFATAISATVDDHNFHIFVAGDGVVAVRERDTGDWLIHRFEYPSEAPFYPIYNADENDKKEWIAEYGSRLKETTYWLGKQNVGTNSEGSCWVEESDGIPMVLTKNTANYDAVAIFSDGVASFQKSNKGPMYLLDVLRNFLSFKNYEGVFVKRRCNAALRQFKESGVSHYDDFSMGCIVLNQE